MLLNGNSGGWSECVGDAGQSYQTKEKKAYSQQIFQKHNYMYVILTETSLIPQ